MHGKVFIAFNDTVLHLLIDQFAEIIVKDAEVTELIGDGLAVFLGNGDLVFAVDLKALDLFVMEELYKVAVDQLVGLLQLAEQKP